MEGALRPRRTATGRAAGLSGPALDVQTAWYVDDDGRLDVTKLPTAFRTFFGEHSEHWPGRFSEYPEAGPQLILRAYLHRVVNGGGRIEREYGLGRGRTDLLVLWPREPGQPPHRSPAGLTVRADAPGQPSSS